MSDSAYAAHLQLRLLRGRRSALSAAGEGRGRRRAPRPRCVNMRHEPHLCVRPSVQVSVYICICAQMHLHLHLHHICSTYRPICLSTYLPVCLSSLPSCLSAHAGPGLHRSPTSGERCLIRLPLRQTFDPLERPPAGAQAGPCGIVISQLAYFVSRAHPGWEAIAARICFPRMRPGREKTTRNVRSTAPGRHESPALKVPHGCRNARRYARRYTRRDRRPGLAGVGGADFALGGPWGECYAALGSRDIAWRHRIVPYRTVPHQTALHAPYRTSTALYRNTA